MNATNAGKLVKQYRYGAWGYVRVEIYQNAIAVYKDPTGTREWFTLAERQKAQAVKLSRVGDKGPVPIGYWMRRAEIEARWVPIFEGWRINGAVSL